MFQVSYDDGRNACGNVAVGSFFVVQGKASNIWNSCIVN